MTTKLSKILNQVVMADIWNKRQAEIKATATAKTQSYKCKEDIPATELSKLTDAEMEAMRVVFENGMKLYREAGGDMMVTGWNGGQVRALKDLARVTGKAAPGKAKLPNPAGIYAARGKS